MLPADEAFVSYSFDGVLSKNLRSIFTFFTGKNGRFTALQKTTETRSFFLRASVSPWLYRIL